MTTTEIQPNNTTPMPTQLQVTPGQQTDPLFLPSVIGGVLLGLLFLIVMVVLIMSIVMVIMRRKKNPANGSKVLYQHGISAINLISRDYETEGMSQF